MNTRPLTLTDKELHEREGWAEEYDRVQAILASLNEKQRATVGIPMLIIGCILSGLLGFIAGHIHL